MSTPKTAIFPASGALGGSISHHLLNFVDPSSLILVSRNPEKWSSSVKRQEEGGPELRAADYDDADSLEKAFVGAKYLCLVSYVSFRVAKRIKVHKLAIDAARRQGVTHIFYCSLAFGGDCTSHSVAHVMQAHLATEQYLASLAAESSSSTPFTYTAIREGIYSESFPIYTAFPDLQSSTPKILIPHDGSSPGIAWAKRDELGEASARLIQHYTAGDSTFLSKYRNKTLLLSGPKVLSLTETIQTLERHLNKKITHQNVSVEEYAAQPQVKSVLTYEPGETAVEWATAWEAIRQGEAAVVSPLLGELLGREPEAFEVTIGKLFAGGVMG